MTSDDHAADKTAADDTTNAHDMADAADMTGSDDMASILEALAAGTIDTSEAAHRIDGLPAGSEKPQPESPGQGSGPARNVGPSDTPAGTGESAQSGSPDDVWSASTDRPQYATHTRESAPATPPSGPTSSSGSPQSPGTGIRPASGVERLSVRAVGRRVRIVGDPAVATISADGPHVLRRNGSTIEVSSDGELGASMNGFQLLRGAPRSLDDFRSLGLGKELLLRINPSLVVDVEVIAGSLHTQGVARLGKIRMTAGGGKLLDVTEVADALVQAGQATVKGAITSGASRIRVESGSLSLSLDDSSNVTVHSDAQLGKISWGGDQTGIAADEVVLGHGDARLDIEVVMGHASITSGARSTGTT